MRIDFFIDNIESRNPAKKKHSSSDVSSASSEVYHNVTEPHLEKHLIFYSDLQEDVLAEKNTWQDQRKESGQVIALAASAGVAGCGEIASFAEPSCVGPNLPPRLKKLTKKLSAPDCSPSVRTKRCTIIEVEDSQPMLAPVSNLYPDSSKVDARPYQT